MILKALCGFDRSSFFCGAICHRQLKSLEIPYHLVLLGTKGIEPITIPSEIRFYIEKVSHYTWLAMTPFNKGDVWAKLTLTMVKGLINSVADVAYEVDA